MKRLPPLAALALLPLLAAAARADAVRPGAAATVTLDHPPGQSPVFRGDNRRSGRAAGFPPALDPLWKLQIQGGIDLPAVAAAGTLVVASSGGSLVNIDLATGKELGRVALPAAPIQGPLLTSRGDRVVITAAGECVATTSAGAVRYRRPLPAKPRELTTAPLTTAAGGLLLAAGSSLLLLDGDGRTVDSASLPEAPQRALVSGPQGALAVGASGKVFRWQPPEAPALVGSLGGPPSSSSALAGRTLVTVVENHRLVFFDLSAGVPGTTVHSIAPLEGPPSVAPGGDVWATSSAGLLLAFNGEGKELARVAQQGSSPDAGSLAAAPLVAAGKVAFLRSSGEVVVWSKDGEISSEQRACLDPIDLLSDGERLVVSCRDGTVAAFGRKP